MCQCTNFQPGYSIENNGQTVILSKNNDKGKQLFCLKTMTKGNICAVCVSYTFLDTVIGKRFSH